MTSVNSTDLQVDCTVDVWLIWYITGSMYFQESIAVQFCADGSLVLTKTEKENKHLS